MSDAIKAKISKLLALSSSSFEEEAKSALLKAQQLMDQYGYSDADISTGVSNQPEIDDVAIMSKGKISIWNSGLINVVARNMRCEVYKSRKPEGGFDLRIFGTQEDIQVCKPSIEFALNAMDKCWKAYKRSRKKSINAPQSRKETEMIKNDYMRSFIQGLERAFADQVKERAIVLTKNSLVTQYKTHLGLGKAKRVRKTSRSDADAIHAGFQDGRSAYATKRIGSYA